VSSLDAREPRPSAAAGSKEGGEESVAVTMAAAALECVGDDDDGE